MIPLWLLWSCDPTSAMVIHGEDSRTQQKAARPEISGQ